MAITVRSKWQGQLLAQRVQQAAVRGANRAAERLRALAVDQAPLRDGPLRGSAFVTEASMDAGNVHAEVGFDTVYAARQHEETGWVHKDGKAKYLSDPLEQNSAELAAIIAAEVRRAL